MPRYEAVDPPNAPSWQPAVVTVLQRLRAEFHDHLIYPSICYDEGQPRLVVSRDVTVWADPAGTFLCWGPVHMEEPAEHAPAVDLKDIARRIVEQLIEREMAATTP